MRQTDIQHLADNASFTPFHGRLLFWCALIIILDGYDLAVVGIALPAIMQELQVAPTNAGLMVSSALFGMAFGAIAFGTLADRIGRRWVIAISVILFSAFTALSALATDPLSFSIMRFIAGVGIGGVMPNVVAHMTEYSPRRMRSTLVTLMFSGYAVGGMIAALLGKGLIESYGWQAIFYAAALPILLVPFMLRSLPESMAYLVARDRQAELARIAAEIEPERRAETGEQWVLPKREQAAKASISQLFADGRSFSTLMLWIAFFACLFMVYALSSWLTKLMAGAGYSLGSALTFVIVLNVGAMIGAVGGGWLADRFHIKYVLTAMYALAAVSITLLGFKLPTPVLFLVVALAGASTIGTQIVANAYTGQFYPAAVRSTGLGWALGIGRCGAILAPIVIGVLMAMQLPLEYNFFAMAIPAVIGMLAVLMVDHRKSASFVAVPVGSRT